MSCMIDSKENYKFDLGVKRLMLNYGVKAFEMNQLLHHFPHNSQILE